MDAMYAGRMWCVRDGCDVRFHIQGIIQENTEILNHVHRGDAAIWVKLKIVIVEKMFVIMEPNELSFWLVEHKSHWSTPLLNFLYTR